jgi:hypothetical protein
VREGYVIDKIHHLLRPDPPDLLLGGSAGGIAEERSGGKITFFPQSTSFLHGSPRSYITRGINNRTDVAAVDRRSITTQA